jgi:chemotaxis protein MotB
MRSESQGGGLRWLLTYADMITLLLAFFVLMYAVSKVDAKRYRELALSIRGALGGPIPAAARAVQEVRVPPRDPLAHIAERLSERMAAELAAQEVQMVREADGVLLRFPDRILFDRGKADLRPSARVVLDKVAQVVADLPNTIEAEGHTDTLPIRSSQYPSNWELSVARATAVVRHLVESHGISPLRCAARGLGEHRPLVPNDPHLGEARNRRVEIRILGK